MPPRLVASPPLQWCSLRFSDLGGTVSCLSLSLAGRWFLSFMNVKLVPRRQRRGRGKIFAYMQRGGAK